MKDTAPKSQGIFAVAALFGIIAAGVALVLYDYWWIAALFIGGIVAAITAIVLMLGWRDPAPHATGPVARQSEPAPTASVAPAADPVPAADPAPATAPEPAAEPEPATEAAPEPAAPVEAAPAVKPSAKLSGEEELKAKKGEWKYDGPGSEAAAPAEPPAASDDGKPQFLSEAREGGPDDLKQIKGVGPKLEKTLHGMGIYHFDQISTWGPSEQAWMDDNLEGFKGRASRDNWVEQAKTLAAGGTTEFSSKVKKGDVY